MSQNGTIDRPLGACPFRLNTTKRRKEGAKFDEAVRFIHMLVDYLDPVEAEYLGGIGALQSYVRDLIDGDVKYLAVAKVVALRHPNTIIHAFVNGCGSDVPDGEAAIVLNDEGAFWNPQYLLSGVQGGTMRCKTLILLHEFCHALEAPGFKSDFDDQAASESNNLIVLKKFPKTFSAISLRTLPSIQSTKAVSYVE